MLDLSFRTRDLPLTYSPGVDHLRHAMHSGAAGELLQHLVHRHRGVARRRIALRPSRCRSRRRRRHEARPALPSPARRVRPAAAQPSTHAHTHARLAAAFFAQPPGYSSCCRHTPARPIAAQPSTPAAQPPPQSRPRRVWKKKTESDESVKGRIPPRRFVNEDTRIRCSEDTNG